jgi:hypothetical protein
MSNGAKLRAAVKFDGGGPYLFSHDAGGWSEQLISAQVPNTPNLDQLACSTSPKGDLHLCGLDLGQGTVYHITNFADGSWQSSWDANFPPPDIRPISQVACATDRFADLHVLAVTRGGTIYHTIRHADGTFADSWEANFPAPDIRPIVRASCTVDGANDLHVLAVTQSGTIYHTIRHADGTFADSWDGNFPPPDIRPVREAACAFETATNLMHVAVLTDRHTQLNQRPLFYSARDLELGDWRPFSWQDVLAALHVEGNLLTVDVSI